MEKSQNVGTKSAFTPKKKNIDLKLIISKILSITFIVTMLLLNRINVAFQSIFVQLNLSESFSKP